MILRVTITTFENEDW
jgi:hypothetical protein